jgi:hypothetical protein
MSLSDDPTLINASFQLIDRLMTIALTWICWLFLDNLYHAILLLYTRRHVKGPRIYISILNVLPNLIGAIASGYAMLQRMKPGMANCRLMLLFDAAVVSIGISAITAILFMRAYYTWMRRRWLRIIGSILVFANIAIGVSMYFSITVYTDSDNYCWMNIPLAWSTFKVTVDVITNLILSGLYLYAVRQIMCNGISTSLYRNLYREGLLATFAVILSSVATAIIVMLGVIESYEAFVYGLDVVLDATIVSRILLSHSSDQQRDSAKGRKKMLVRNTHISHVYPSSPPPPPPPPTTNTDAIYSWTRNMKPPMSSIAHRHSTLSMPQINSYHSGMRFALPDISRSSLTLSETLLDNDVCPHHGHNSDLVCIHHHHHHHHYNHDRIPENMISSHEHTLM